MITGAIAVFGLFMLFFFRGDTRRLDFDAGKMLLGEENSIFIGNASPVKVGAFAYESEPCQRRSDNDANGIRAPLLSASATPGILSSASCSATTSFASEAVLVATTTSGLSTLNLN